jgi:hypothetical protein
MKPRVSDSLISVAQQELLALPVWETEQDWEIQQDSKQMKSPVFDPLVVSVQLVLMGLAVQEIEQNL